MRSMVWEKRVPAAGGGSRAHGFTAAVEKRTEKRKPEAFFGYRKEARSDEAASSSLATPTTKKQPAHCAGCFFISGVERFNYDDIVEGIRE